MRAPALPLPYLRSPTIDFVVYISPLLYLTLLRSTSTSQSETNKALPEFDVPIAALRKALVGATRSSDAVLATLALVSPDAPAAHFAQPVDASHLPLPAPSPEAAVAGTLPSTHAWELRFSHGVLMSQSRMLAVHSALALAPGLSGAGSAILSPSWLDILVRHVSDLFFSACQLPSPAERTQHQHHS
jgi:hypothetical protein